MRGQTRRQRVRDTENIYTARLCVRICYNPATDPSGCFGSSLLLLYCPPATTATGLPVLGLDEVGEGLGLLEAVVVAVGVVVLRADVLHLVNAAALGAPLDRALAGHLRTGVMSAGTSHTGPEPCRWVSGEHSPRARRRCGSQPEHRCNRRTAPRRQSGPSRGCRACLPAISPPSSLSHSCRWSWLTLPRGVERPHVENINALHLAEDFEALKTGRLLEIGGDSARLGTGPDEVVSRPHLCPHKTNRQPSVLPFTASRQLCGPPSSPDFSKVRCRPGPRRQWTDVRSSPGTHDATTTTPNHKNDKTKKRLSYR